MDFRERRIAIAPAHLKPAWDEVFYKYPIGSRHTGEVVNVMSYGIFIKLGPGIEGLLHKEEMAKQHPVGHPRERYAIGDSVEVTIVCINPSKQEMALGLG